MLRHVRVHTNGAFLKLCKLSKEAAEEIRTPATYFKENKELIKHSLCKFTSDHCRFHCNPSSVRSNPCARSGMNLSI